MDNRHADLVRLGDSIAELTERVERLKQAFYDVNGVDDLIMIAEEIQRLQTELSLPRIAEMCLTKESNVIAFKVWDPRFPDRRGMQGYIAQYALRNKRDAWFNELNLPIVIDYLSRSLRYVRRMLRAHNEGADPPDPTPSRQVAATQIPSEYRSIPLTKKYAARLHACMAALATVVVG